MEDSAGDISSAPEPVTGEFSGARPLTPEQWRNVETVLAGVLVLPEEEQTAYLDGLCVGAPELRAEVEWLLAGRQQSTGEQQWRQVETVLAGVLVLPEEEQTAYLDGVCVGAPELRARIESLLTVRQRNAGTSSGGRPLTPEQWRNVETVLAGVLALPEEEQTAYLDGVCLGAPEMRAEVDALLAVRQHARNLLETPSTMVGRRIGPYRLLREIGRGGMGAVYLAERQEGQFQQTVAIKLLAASLRTAGLERRFRDERQILAILDHPHIARLLDGGVTPDGLPFLVMEYVDGRSLIDYCESAGLAVPQRLALFQKICSAVAFAHRHLIVHRDIKPGNLLITAEGVPKLVDFGIAKMVGQTPSLDTVTFAGLHPMTPEYASPEQIRGAAITTATDVYSLGVVLFELLTGRRPFQLSGVTFEEASRIVCHERPPRPGSIRQGIAPELDAIVAKAIAKEPVERYDSPQALADDIGRYLTGLPVVAHPGSRI